MIVKSDAQRDKNTKYGKELLRLKLRFLRDYGEHKIFE